VASETVRAFLKFFFQNPKRITFTFLELLHAFSRTLPDPTSLAADSEFGSLDPSQHDGHGSAYASTRSIA